ncbi:hypothetical protein STEG23_008981, partial [Scotinomys teguina]
NQCCQEQTCLTVQKVCTADSPTAQQIWSGILCSSQKFPSVSAVCPALTPLFWSWKQSGLCHLHCSLLLCSLFTFP